MLFDFQTFVIRESNSEAKDFLNSLIRKNLLNNIELNDSKSAYNQIKNLLKQNSGYIGFFVRKFYTEALDEIEKNSITQPSIEDQFDKKFPTIQNIYKNILELKKYKINLNLQDFRSNSLVEIDAMFEQMLAAKYRPGIVLNENDVTRPLHNLLNKSNYKVILAVKKHGNEYLPDHQAILWWSSPKWCIKSQSTFQCTWVKDKNHLQYIFIHDSVYEEVFTAAALGQQDEIQLVPRNFNLSILVNYSAFDNVNYRIGITTKPIHFKKNPFQTNTSNTYPIQNDNNNYVDKSNFAQLILPIKFEILDMAVRSLIGISKSQFDTKDVSLLDLIRFVNLDFTETKDETLLEYLRATYIAIKPHLDMPMMQTIFEEAIDMMRKQPNTFKTLYYLLFFMKDIPNDLLTQLEQYWGEDLEQLPFEYTLGTYQLLLELRNNGTITNQKLIKIFDSVSTIYVKELLEVKNADNLSSNIDFKSTLLQTYANNKANNDYSSIGLPINVEKTSKLLSDYLFKYNKEKGEQIIKQRKWDKEKEFAETILQKIKTNDLTDNPELEKEMKRLINVHSKTFQGTENLFYVLEETYESREYDQNYHNSAVKTAMKLYMQKINPKIKKAFNLK